MSELLDTCIVNYAHRYSVGFFLRKRAKKTSSKTFYYIIYTLHSRFLPGFRLFYRQRWGHIAGTLRVEVVSRSSGRLAHKRTNMQLHSRACSPGCQIGSYRRCFPKSIVDARFPFTQKIPACFLMHESSTPLPALLIKCDGCRILEGIWVDYCFLLHGVRFLIRNL